MLEANCCRNIVTAVLGSIPSRASRIARLMYGNTRVRALFFRSSSATGLGGQTNPSTTGSPAATTAHGLLRLAPYHTAYCSTVAAVGGVDASLNVTITTTAAATGITSKIIEETTKPSIVVTTIAAGQASVLLLMVGWPPSPPLSPSCGQLLLLLLFVTGSVLSRALHFTVHLARACAGPGRR